MDAVASSRTKIFLFFSSSLARQTSCLCPTLQFSPFSATAHVFKQIKTICHIDNGFFIENKKHNLDQNCRVEAVYVFIYLVHQEVLDLAVLFQKDGTF